MKRVITTTFELNSNEVNTAVHEYIRKYHPDYALGPVVYSGKIEAPVASVKAESVIAPMPPAAPVPSFAPPPSPTPPTVPKGSGYAGYPELGPLG